MDFTSMPPRDPSLGLSSLRGLNSDGLISSQPSRGELIGLGDEMLRRELMDMEAQRERMRRGVDERRLLEEEVRKDLEIERRIAMRRRGIDELVPPVGMPSHLDPVPPVGMPSHLDPVPPFYSSPPVMRPNQLVERLELGHGEGWRVEGHPTLPPNGRVRGIDDPYFSHVHDVRGIQGEWMFERPHVPHIPDAYGFERERVFEEPHFKHIPDAYGFERERMFEKPQFTHIPDVSAIDDERVDMRRPHSTHTRNVSGPKKNTVVGGKRKADDLICKICNVTVTGMLNMDSHVKGKKHKAKVAAQNAIKATQNAATASSLAIKTDDATQGPPEKRRKDKDNEEQTTKKIFTCELCKVNCDNPFNLYNHLRGRKHKDMLEESKPKAPDNKEETGTSEGDESVEEPKALSDVEGSS